MEVALIMVNNLPEHHSLGEAMAAAPTGVHLRLEAMGARQNLGEAMAVQEVAEIAMVQEEKEEEVAMGEEATGVGIGEHHLLMVVAAEEEETVEETVDMEVVAAAVALIVVAVEIEEDSEAAVVAEVVIETVVAAMATPIVSCLTIKSMPQAFQPTYPKMILLTFLAPLVSSRLTRELASPRSGSTKTETPENKKEKPQLPMTTLLQPKVPLPGSMAKTSMDQKSKSKWP
jgi:hypothetical protein